MSVRARLRVPGFLGGASFPSAIERDYSGGGGAAGAVGGMWAVGMVGGGAVVHSWLEWLSAAAGAGGAVPPAAGGGCGRG